jgi:single-strand DNA-binding protein
MGVSNNEVRIEGRITAEPELRYTQSEKAVCRFTLAVSREWSDRDEADFIPVVAWNGTAKAMAEHVVKGQLLTVAGRLQSRSYETQDGQKRTVLEVIAREVKFGRKPKAKAEAHEQAAAAETAEVA